MRKYLTLLSVAWQAGLAYPFSVGLWRFRQMLSTIMALTLWTVIYQGQNSAFGYDRDQMISYIFLVSVLQGAVMATSLHGLSGEVYSGSLSQLLTKPVKLFPYWAMSEFADKLKNVGFIIVEMLLLFVIFQPQLVVPDLATGLLFLLWVAGAIVIHFYIELLFGAIGFWSPETWGPKFLFFMVIEATVGKLFPLDILPITLQRILYLTPFPYLSYAQTQLFLGRVSGAGLWQNTLVIAFWCVVLWWLAKTVWKRGLRGYAAAGN